MTFRKLLRTDIPFLVDVRNECAEEFLHTSAQFSVEQAYHWYDTTHPMFYIILNNDVPIGYFRLSNYSSTNKNLYIGADLHKDYRGKGLAYEAYRKFIPYIIKQYDLHKVSLEVLSTNIRAYNLYIKLGFITEGIRREEVSKNQTYIDSIIMSILTSEVEENDIYQ